MYYIAASGLADAECQCTATSGMTLTPTAWSMRFEKR
jgi:hypothetical protein